MADIVSQLHQELVNVVLLLEAALKIGLYTGLILVPIILIGYESFGKRRRP